MVLESGGNPAAVGQILADGTPARDALGNILETGLAQLYSPSEVKAAGTTVAAMRAGCATEGKTRAEWETLLRPLTPAELHEHGRALCAIVAAKRRLVANIAHDAGLFGVWTQADLWRLVKLHHGIPSYVTQGLDAVIRLMGKAPPSFADFAARLPIVAGATAGRVPKVLANVEKFAAGLSPTMSRL